MTDIIFVIQCDRCRRQQEVTARADTSLTMVLRSVMSWYQSDMILTITNTETHESKKFLIADFK